MIRGHCLDEQSWWPKLVSSKPDTRTYTRVSTKCTGMEEKNIYIYLIFFEFYFCVCFIMYIINHIHMAFIYKQILGYMFGFLQILMASDQKTLWTIGLIEGSSRGVREDIYGRGVGDWLNVRGEISSLWSGDHKAIIRVFNWSVYSVMKRRNRDHQEKIHGHMKREKKTGFSEEEPVERKFQICLNSLCSPSCDSPYDAHWQWMLIPACGVTSEWMIMIIKENQYCSNLYTASVINWFNCLFYLRMISFCTIEWHAERLISKLLIIWPDCPSSRLPSFSFLQGVQDLWTDSDLRVRGGLWLPWWHHPSWGSFWFCFLTILRVVFVISIK